MTRLKPALTALALVSFACSPPAPRPAPSPSAAKASDDVVARIDGEAIGADELDKRVEKRLSRLRQEEFEIRQEALTEIIGERLVAKEAKARGLSKEELLRDEVDRQVPPPDPKLVEQVYEQNKARFGPKKKDDVLVEIGKALHDRALGERRLAFQDTLRQKAKVQVALEPPRTEVSIPASAPSLGPSTAAITIVEFSDYQCPYCHRAQSTLEKVMSAYEGKVQLVHRDFPLEGHPQAFPAARAARCAGEQGKFWDYHKSLMTVRGPMDDADLQSRAAGLKLDPGAFGTCLASDRHDAAIRESLEAGTRAGVSGTPAYFINGRLLSGARPFESFRDIIDSELRRGSS